MCVVSMVTKDWMHPTWPDIGKDCMPGPNSIPWPVITQDPKLAEQMLEVLKKLEAIDKRLGLLEQCKVSEPQKKKIRRSLKKIAASVDGSKSPP